MSPRIAFWTSSFEPRMEAIASEVALLRRDNPCSFAWGVSHRHWFFLSPAVGWCVHPRLHLVFRAVTRAAERFFEINHVFGSLGDWFYLEGPRRRPTVLTVAARVPPVEPALLRRVDLFVTESPGLNPAVQKAGIEPGRIRTIFPPVDLDRFQPAPPPVGPFTVLFASSPDRADWLEGRGVGVLLDAAAARPDLRFRLLWRPWGDSEPAVRRSITERGLQNVELVVSCSNDMAREYASAHVTVAPFVEPNQSKPVPNSVVESLACGRPVVVTEVVEIGRMVEEAGAGRCVAAGGAEIASALDDIRTGWADYSQAARGLAERNFSLNGFLSAYRGVYRELLESASRPA